MKRDDHVDPELQALLKYRRVVRRAPPDVRARALMGARRILAGGDAVSVAPMPVPPRPLPPARGRLVMRVALAAAIVIAGGTVGAVMFVRGRPVPAPAASPVASAAGLPANLPLLVATPSVPAVPEEVPPPASSAHRRRAAGDVDPFAVQLALLQRAQAAYTRHDFAGALALLDEHARRFPRGHLAEEREALRVRSLLGAGRRQEAHQANAQFARRFPRSVLLPSLQKEERALE